MALRGKGRLVEYETGRVFIYVSKDIWSDSAFPFERGDEVEIEIDPDQRRLIVTPSSDNREQA